MSFGLWAAVAGLGGCGAVARFVTDAIVSQRFGRGFPYGTLVINLGGAFVLGLLVGLALTGDALLLAGTATVGSYTTFSTWMLQTHRLADAGHRRAAIANVVFSLVAGVAAAALGRVIGTAL